MTGQKKIAPTHKLLVSTDHTAFTLHFRLKGSLGCFWAMFDGSYPLDRYLYWSTYSVKNHNILCEYFSFSVQVQFFASLFRQKENIYLISEAGAALNEWQTKCHKSFTLQKVTTSWEVMIWKRYNIIIDLLDL